MRRFCGNCGDEFSVRDDLVQRCMCGACQGMFCTDCCLFIDESAGTVKVAPELDDLFDADELGLDPERDDERKYR